MKETKNDQGEYHSFNDEPAIIYPDGSKYWYKNGKPHRDSDKPAVIYANGYKAWYKNGKRHRDNDEPARIYSDGYKAWYKNGKLHRDNDQPAITDSGGYKAWYKDGVEYTPEQKAEDAKIKSFACDHKNKKPYYGLNIFEPQGYDCLDCGEKL